MARGRSTSLPWAGPSGATSLTCVGPSAAATLARFRFDLAVIGAAGLSLRWGLTELDDADAEIQRLAIERADRLVVIADGSKIGTAANAVVAEARLIQTLVTDEGAPTVEVAALRGLGIEIVIAGRDEPAGDQSNHGDPA